MTKIRRELLQFLIHAACGAFLAALAAVSVQFWWDETNWWFVGICALFGFALAGLLREQAIDFLKELFWRS